MTQHIDGHGHQITQSGDIVTNNIVHIHHHQATGQTAVAKPKIVIQPGPEHIGDTQRAALKALVDDVVKLEAVARRAPKGHASVWGALNKRMKASSYHLIMASDYPRAEKFLREWIGRLSSTKSAVKKDPEWRKRKYAYIFTNVKMLGRQQALNQLLQERYSAESVKDIADEQLAAVYQVVAGWKRTAAAAPSQAKPAAVSRRA